MFTEYRCWAATLARSGRTIAEGVDCLGVWPHGPAGRVEFVVPPGLVSEGDRIEVTAYGPGGPWTFQVVVDRPPCKVLPRRATAAPEDLFEARVCAPTVPGPAAA